MVDLTTVAFAAAAAAAETNYLSVHAAWRMSGYSDAYSKPRHSSGINVQVDGII